MRNISIKNILRPVAYTTLTALSPLTYLSAVWLKFILKRNRNIKIEDAIFSHVGMLPVLDHYYQPLINPRKHLKKPLDESRPLPGIDFNDEEQLQLLNQFDYNNELLEIPVDKPENKNSEEFFYNNVNYCSGDAEYLYSMVRHIKPKRIIEVGSGFSTLLTLRALEKNKSEDSAYQCEHICIEPYEMPWLETKDIKLKRNKVEDISLDFFSQLEENDILFIDSSHIIRPQGDVLFTFLEVLPVLKPGVIVHLHDVFTPKDYPGDWIIDKRLLWNEQYLLEAFLSFNDNYKVIGAVNYLSHKYREKFSAKCPVFAVQPYREPAAFWMRKL